MITKLRVSRMTGSRCKMAIREALGALNRPIIGEGYQVEGIE